MIVGQFWPLLKRVWMVLGGLEHWWVVMRDCRAILASVKALWVLLGGLGCRWVMLDGRAILAAV